MYLLKIILSPLATIFTGVRKDAETKNFLATTPKIRTVGKENVISEAEWLKYVKFGTLYTVRNWLAKNSFQCHDELQKSILYSQSQFSHTFARPYSAQSRGELTVKRNNVTSKEFRIRSRIA